MKNIRDLYRGISDFRKGYQPRTNIVKDEKGDFVTDSHKIMSRWRKYFSWLLNVHGVNDVRQTEIQTAVPLVPEPSALELEMATDKLKGHRSTGTDQIPAELNKAGGMTLNCLSSGRSRPMYLFIKRVIQQTVVIIKAYHFYQLHTKFYPTSCCQG